MTDEILDRLDRARAAGLITNKECVAGHGRGRNQEGSNAPRANPGRDRAVRLQG